MLRTPTTARWLALLAGFGIWGTAGLCAAEVGGSASSLPGAGSGAGSGTSRPGSTPAVPLPDPLDPDRPSVSPVAPPKCTSCGERTFGTTVEWETSPPEAARKAEEQQKLVFVLHVSGHFENAGAT